MMGSSYKIGVIVTWFGNLPSYFPAWLKSAEANSSIDFIVISDQDVVSDKSNILIHKTTLSSEIKKYQKVLGRRVAIQDAYKFCDCRLFFGVLYAELLQNYDFWGYCDIDLIFGNIRNFVTDDVLKQNDRIYMYGHLCLYRNNEQMNHIYDLTGGIYSLDEIFEGKAKTTPEEHFGVNRICRLNHIKVYQKREFADLHSFLPMRLNMARDTNYTHQTFLWEDGGAYRVYEEDDMIRRQELVYIHFQKRKPILDCTESEFANVNCFLISAEKFVSDVPALDTVELLDFYNPPVTKRSFAKARRKYLRKKMKMFIVAPLATKRIWLRQIRYRIGDRH